MRALQASNNAQEAFVRLRFALKSIVSRRWQKFCVTLVDRMWFQVVRHALTQKRRFYGCGGGGGKIIPWRCHRDVVSRKYENIRCHE